MINDRYKYIKDLGRGGSGYIKLVYDRHLSMKKVIKEVTLCSPEQMEAFTRETETLKRLKHKGIPVISDQWIDQNTGYIVMDYCEGIPLDSYINTTKHLSIEKTLAIMCELVELVLTLHTANPRIIHGDLKPENLILSSMGLHLLDFGTAYFDNGGNKSYPALALTYGYASPDLLSGSCCTIESDLYALGMIFFFMLTGKDVRNYPEKKIGEEDFPMEFDYRFKKIFCKCISGYHHTVELLDDLHILLESLQNNHITASSKYIKKQLFSSYLLKTINAFKKYLLGYKKKKHNYVRLEYTLLTDGGHILFALLIGLALGVFLRISLPVCGAKLQPSSEPLALSLQTQAGDNVLLKPGSIYEDYAFPKIRISDRKLKHTGEYSIIVSVDSPEGKHLSQSFSYRKLSR